jgi:hypothetical protein
MHNLKNSYLKTSIFISDINKMLQWIYVGNLVLINNKQQKGYLLCYFLCFLFFCSYFQLLVLTVLFGHVSDRISFGSKNAYHQ